MLITGFAGSLIAEAAGLMTAAIVFALLYAVAMSWNAIGPRAVPEASRNAAATRREA